MRPDTFLVMIFAVNIALLLYCGFVWKNNPFHKWAYDLTGDRVHQLRNIKTISFRAFHTGEVINLGAIALASGAAYYLNYHLTDMLLLVFNNDMPPTRHLFGFIASTALLLMIAVTSIFLVMYFVYSAMAYYHYFTCLEATHEQRTDRS